MNKNVVCDVFGQPIQVGDILIESGSGNLKAQYGMILSYVSQVKDGSIKTICFSNWYDNGKLCIMKHVRNLSLGSKTNRTCMPRLRLTEDQKSSRYCQLFMSALNTSAEPHHLVPSVILLKDYPHIEEFGTYIHGIY